MKTYSIPYSKAHVNNSLEACEGVWCPRSDKNFCKWSVQLTCAFSILMVAKLFFYFSYNVFMIANKSHNNLALLLLFSFTEWIIF